MRESGASRGTSGAITRKENSCGQAKPAVTMTTVVTNLTAHYSRLGELSDSITRNSDLLGLRCGLGISLRLNSPGDSNEQLRQRMAAFGILIANYAFTLENALKCCGSLQKTASLRVDFPTVEKAMSQCSVVDMGVNRGRQTGSSGCPQFEPY